jgi:hypothetical protein
MLRWRHFEPPDRGRQKTMICGIGGRRRHIATSGLPRTGLYYLNFAGFWYYYAEHNSIDIDAFKIVALKLFEISPKLTPIFTKFIYIDSCSALSWSQNSRLFVPIRG